LVDVVSDYKKIHARQAEAEQTPQPQENPPAIVRLVWLPEGFVITPRSAQAPQGRGLPPNADGSYTPGGPLPQVIINQLPHNGYPDALYRQEMQKAGIAPVPAATRVCAANLFFKDWELLDEGFGIGLHLPDPKDSKKTIWRAQFKNRFETNFAEAKDETGKWYCHRPQFAQENGVRQYLRQQTNAIRNLAGQKDLGAPLRGMEGELSESPAYMTQYSGVFGHDSYQFPQGHISALMRVDRAATGPSKGENLHLQPGSNADVTTANIAVQGWRTSPGHYANMIRDWHDGDGSKYYASLDSAVRPLLPDAAVHTTQDKPYGLDATYSPLNPPVKPAIVSAQIFDGRKDWVFHNGIPRASNDELLPLIECRLLRHVYFHFSGNFILNETSGSFLAYANSRKPPAAKNDWLPRFAWRGRLLYLGEALRDINRFEIMAVKEVTRNGSIAALRVACREQSADDDNVHIVLYEGAITDFAATCTEIGRLDISGNDSHVFSTPVFSESGEKMALMLARLDTTHANSAIPNDWGTSITGCLGQILHFFEFADGAFTQVDVAQIDIAPRHEKKGADPYSFEASQSLTASCRYLPVYAGETLEYVVLHIDSHFYFKDTEVENANGMTEHEIENNFRLFCELKFPGGTRIVCYDLSAPDFASDIIGFYRVILALDVQHPQSALLARYDMPPSSASASQELQFVPVALECGGSAFKTSPKPLAGYLYNNGQRAKTTLSPANMKGDVNSDGKASIGWGGIRQFEYELKYPTTVMLAGLSSQHEIINTSAGPRKVENPYFLLPRSTQAPEPGLIRKGGLFRYENLFLGPLVAEQNYHYSLYSHREWDPVRGGNVLFYPKKLLQNRFYYARFGDAWIHAGKIDQVFGPIGENARKPHIPSAPWYGDIKDVGWLGDDQYYFFSNLDVREITGMPDLSDNILPIGII